MEGKRPSESQITLTQLMGPTNANNLGNVHGGFIMKLCDEAGGMAATKHARRPAVTVAVDSMAFHSPVSIGNLMTVRAEITWVGRTSMETRVVVTAENVISGAVTHTNTAYFVYVALDGPISWVNVIWDSDGRFPSSLFMQYLREVGHRVQRDF